MFILNYNEFVSNMECCRPQWPSSSKSSSNSQACDPAFALVDAFAAVLKIVELSIKQDPAPKSRRKAPEPPIK